MKIGILETGKVNPALVPDHGEYVPMFRDFLHLADTSVEVEGWDVIDAGRIPASPHDADGWIVTGSAHGVYDGLPWMEPLKAFLRETYAAKVPIVGVCFGHQILAEAMGGKVVKSDRGWGAGVHSYRLEDGAPEWMAGGRGTVNLHAMHQDQVVEKPEGARVIASSEFCDYAGLAYGDADGDRAMSIQPHPEFDASYEAGIIHLRRGGSGIPDDVADRALGTLEGGVDNALFAGWVVSFFRQALARRGAERESA